jgi:hypothetical protein
MVDHHIAFMRRSTACLLVATSLLWLALVDLTGGQSIAVGTIRALSTVIPFRPSIYTFTEHAPKKTTTTFAFGKHRGKLQALTPSISH